MAESDAIHTLLSEASFQELWFKLHHVVRISQLCDEQGWQGTIRLDAFMLVVANRDEVHVAIDDHLYSLKRGAMLVGEPGQTIAYMGGLSMEEEDAGCVMFFHMQGSPSARDELVRRLRSERCGGVAPEAAAAALLNLCEKVWLYWHAPSRLERLLSQAAFQEMIYHLLRQTAAPPPHGLDAALEQLRVHLELHYHEQSSLEQLAQTIGISSRHLRRTFKLRFGISATDYVTDLRISQAKRLMTTTKQPVAEIARQVGYQDESHFRRTFKNRMGISPATYVRNRQMKVAACSFPNIGQLLPLSVIPFAAPIDHDWTDAYRRKYRTEVLYPLRHHNELNRRTLAAAKPDRILAIDVFGSADFQQKLGEIAPVLVIPWRTKSWREHLLMTASFLSKTQEADDWLAAYDDKADQACRLWNRLAGRERLRIVMVDRQDCYMWKERQDGLLDSRHSPFAPARHRPGLMDPAFERVTPDELHACEADRIVLLLSEDRQSQLTWKALQRSERWRALKAVRQNRVHPVRLGPWFEYTAYNHGVILDQTIKALSQVDG